MWDVAVRASAVPAAARRSVRGTPLAVPSLPVRKFEMRTASPPYAGAEFDRAVFLDKDGTLVVDVPYNVDPAKLEFERGCCEALAALAAAGFALVIVSNQSGLALGRFTPEAFKTLRRVLAQRLWREAGVALLDFVYCPHAPGSCACRKPSSLMLERVAFEHELDLSRSWMVGDTLDDVEAGRRAGCRTVLYESGGETTWWDAPLRRPHARHDNWADVARTVLADPPSPRRARREHPAFGSPA